MKRKLPIKLKYTGECARAEGIKPGKTWTMSQRKKVSTCVLRKLRVAK